MAGYLTSSTLINQIKLIGMIPQNQSTFADADFLALANTEVKMGLLPSILQHHEEFYVRDSAAITITASQSSYPIPYRAIGGKFRELFYQDTSGNLRTMTRISPDDRPAYQSSSYNNQFVHFFIQGNDVVLVPSVGSSPSGSLVFSYYMRPNDLVDASRVGHILSSSVGASTTIFTLDQVPASLTAFYQGGNSITGFASSGVKLDVLQTNPGHKTISFDITPTNVDSTNKTITFNNSDLGSTIIPGDYIALAGECIIPQIPTELHDVLAQRVSNRCLQALGDAQGFQMGQSKLGEMEKNTGTLVDNRAEGSPRKANNMQSHLRNSSYRRRGWR